MTTFTQGHYFIAQNMVVDADNTDAIDDASVISREIEVVPLIA